jgi:hypothetical protein
MVFDHCSDGGDPNPVEGSNSRNFTPLSSPLQ